LLTAARHSSHLLSKFVGAFTLVRDHSEELPSQYITEVVSVYAGLKVGYFIIDALLGDKGWCVACSRQVSLYPERESGNTWTGIVKVCCCVRI